MYGVFGVGASGFEERCHNLNLERPEYYFARAAILDYFGGVGALRLRKK